VREAERKLAAATAKIGVAVADLYPKFNLIGAASFTSNHLSNLLSGDNFGVAGLGQITWPIFHGGQIRANIRAKEEETQQAYLSYQQAVLKALQDSEDALARFTSERQRLLSLQTAVQSARSSERIAEQQYRAGLVTYLNVLTAQSTLLNAEDQLTQSRQALAQDLVSVYKALGGGWFVAPASAVAKIPGGITMQPRNKCACFTAGGSPATARHPSDPGTFRPE
jgi:multidrug efflux system outer membrane protein